VPKTRTVSPCFSMAGLTCGPMKKMESTRCYSQTNAVFVDDPVDIIGTPCEGRVGSVLVDCPNPAPCPAGAFWQYGAWGMCSSAGAQVACPATSEMRHLAVDGEQTRTADCVKYTGGVLGPAIGECSSDALEARVCSRKCFYPLPKFVQTRGECISAACGEPGERTVTYATCSPGAPGCMSYMGAVAGMTTEACPALPCSPCDGNYCVAENTVSATAGADARCMCTCVEGYEGSRCHKKAGVTLSLLDASGTQCASGVTDRDGSCCDSGARDGCGYCEGAAVAGLGTYRVGLDIAGACCAGNDPSIYITGSYECCASADLVDECGVCNGSGDTCNKQADGSIDPANPAAYGVTTFGAEVEALLPAGSGLQVYTGGAYTTVTAAARRRRLLAATSASYRIPPGAAFSAAELAAKFFVAGQAAATNGDLAAAPDVPEPIVVGVAGNGVCESGETSLGSLGDCIDAIACPAATPFATDSYLGVPTEACSGNGLCNRASGVCDCSAGYDGPACDVCDAAGGYVDIELGSGLFACTKLAGDFPAAPGVDPTPGEPTPDGPVAKDTKKSGLGIGAIIGIAVGAVGAIGVIVGVAYYCIRVKGAKNIGPA
jgi:EGF-like domain